MELPPELLRRRTLSHEVIQTLENHLGTLPPGLSLSAIGSVGRGEVGPGSDLDLILVDSDSFPIGECQPLVDRLTIRLRQGEGFLPSLSKGGFLRVHRLNDLLSGFGQPPDDGSNRFTIRLLLLLESQPVIGVESRRESIQAAVTAYRRRSESEARIEQLLPLVTDITRYWKTLCLTHGSSDYKPTPDSVRHDRFKILKLRFARLWTCFASVAYLTASHKEEGQLSENRVVEMTGLSPLARFSFAAERSTASDAFESALDDYLWYLDRVSDEESESHLDLIRKEHWEEGLGRADKFAASIFRLIQGVDDPYMMRRLAM